MILEIGPRGPISYQIFLDYKIREKKTSDGVARRGSRRLDSRDRGEEVRLMKSIGPQRGFESLPYNCYVIKYRLS